MPYPHIDCQFLMYSDVKAAMTHQTRASALPDFSYLAKGRSDYWIAQSPAREQKRKTLILADWSASKPMYYKMSEVKALLTQLMTDGFEIYLWQTDHLLKMQENNLALLHQSEIAKGMIAPSYQSIETVASASPYRLAKDRVQILDDYWITYLLGDNPVPGPRHLGFLDFLRFADRDRSLILSFLNTAQPKIQSLALDTAFFPQRALPGFDQLVRVFPDLKINHSYRHLTLLSHDYDLDHFKGAEWDVLELVIVRELSFSVQMLIKLLTLGKRCKKIELHECAFNELPGFSLEGIAPL